MTQDDTEFKGKVRARDPETSWQAASLQTRPKCAAIQLRILATLRHRGPLTDEEILLAIGNDSYEIRGEVSKATPSSLRTRRKELELDGKVVTARGDDGKPLKRKTLAGGPSKVWRIVADTDPAPELEPLPEPGQSAHERGLAAARRLSLWEIGDPSWADLLTTAYLNPEETQRKLDEEQEN